MNKENNIFDHLKVRKVETPDQEYFSNLSQSILSTVQSEAKVIPLYKKPIIWISSAAAIVAAIFLVNLNEQVVDTQLAFTDISTEEAFSYIEENIDDFDVELITDQLTDESLEVNTETMEVSEEVFNSQDPIGIDDLNTEDILDYLLEEGIDLNDESDELFI